MHYKRLPAKEKHCLNWVLGTPYSTLSLSFLSFSHELCRSGVVYSVSLLTGFFILLEDRSLISRIAVRAFHELN